MQELRQSTEIKVRVGSAVDATDGVSPETGLTLGAADQAELLKHNGVAAVDISGRTFAAVASSDGWYDLTLTTTDTNTLGQLTALVQDSSLMAPIFRDFMVVKQQYWDSKYSTDTLQVDVTQWLGTAAAAPTVAGVPEIDVTHIAGAVVATGTAQLGVNVVSEDNIDFGALKKTSLNASTPASVTTVTGNVDGNVGGSVGSLTGHTNQTGDNYPVVSHADYGNAKLVRSTTPANVLDVSATGEAGLDFDNVKDATGAHTLTNITVPAVTTVTGNVDGNVGGSVGSLTGHTNQTGDNFTRIGAAGASLTDLGGMSVGMKAEVQTEANDALIAQNLDHLVKSAVNVDFSTTVQLDSVIGQLADVGTVATYDRAQESLEAIRARGDAAWTTGAGGSPPTILQNTTIATLASQTSFTLTAGSTDDDAYKNATIIVEDSVTPTQKCVGTISGYTGATKTVTLDPDPAIFTMAVGDTVDIIAGGESLSETQVADAVWDETMSGHTTSGTFGNHISKKLLSVAKFLGLK